MASKINLFAGLIFTIFVVVRTEWMWNGNIWEWRTDPKPLNITCFPRLKKCPASHTCMNGLCYPTVQQGISCQYLPCPRSDIYKCRKGECIMPRNGVCTICDATPFPMISCGMQGDCPHDCVCLMNGCWPRVEPGGRCLSGRTCRQPDIYKCINELCRVPDESDNWFENEITPITNKECKRTTECGDGFMCRKSLCYPTQAANSRCQVDIDCRQYSSDAMYKCRKETCVISPQDVNKSPYEVTPKPDVKTCTSTVMHCGPGYMCRLGKCWLTQILTFSCDNTQQCQRFNSDGLYQCVDRICKII